MSSSRTFASLCTSALALAAHAAPALAADATADDAPAIIVYGRPDGYDLDKTPTATKTDTPLIDVPQTVNVISVKQIEDAANQYVAMRTTSFGGKDKRLQEDVHEQPDTYQQEAQMADEDQAQHPAQSRDQQHHHAAHGPAQIEAVDTQPAQEEPQHIGHQGRLLVRVVLHHHHRFARRRPLGETAGRYVEGL